VKKIIATSFAALIALITFAPFFWMISASLMHSGEANTYPPRLFPSELDFSHYVDLFRRLNLFSYLKNSVILSVAVTAVSLLINSMAGYAFAKYRFPKKDIIFNFLISSMVIPGQVTMLPLFLLLKHLGFINTYFAIIIPGMVSIFGIFLIRQYAQTIPDSLIEAAKMDGASETLVYWRVILPLCKPILVTLGIFTFMGTWNDFLWPLIVMTDSSMYTMPVAVANLMGEHVQDTELMMAGSVLTTMPMVLLFIVLQKYYIHGIMVGGVKE
jgi:multiple sugar transport system permease protein